MIICELSHGQIMQFTYDKLVNYEIFDKFGINLFNGLYIRVNNGSDVKPITNYKLLCYVIYYFSGMILKYNYWYIEKNQTIQKQNTINPLYNKVIIHTVIDLINSILEINTRKNKNYIYDSISTKFLNKLVNIYDDKQVGTKDAIDRLINISDKKIQITGTKIRIKSKDANLVRKLDNYTIMGQLHDFGLNKHKFLPGKYFINIFDKKKTYMDIFSNEKLEEINKKCYANTLEKIYNNYDDTGMKLNNTRSIATNTSSESKIKIFQKHAENIMKKELKEAENIELAKQKNDALNNDIQRYNQSSYKDIKIHDNLTEKVNNLIELMEASIGKNININNMHIYLTNTVYIVDHDHMGTTKKEPLIFKEDDNRMEFKKNDKFFETDVYSYTDKVKNITVYYDGNGLYLLGYREMNKEYKRVLGTGKYLKINYSIKNKLVLLGHSHINYKLDTFKEPISDSDSVSVSETKKNNILGQVSDIIRKRIHNLKNIIREFQSIIYQIKNKVISTGSNILVKQFSDKFKDLKYYDNGVKIFDNWKSTIDEIYFIAFKSNLSIEIHNDYLHASKMLKYINNDVIIIHYLIEQITLFLTINKNNNKLVIVTILIINQLFDQYNIDETIYYNDEVRKYSLLQTDVSSYVDNAEIFDVTVLTDDVTEKEEEAMTDEQKQHLETQREDNKETEEGMDLDINIGDDTDEGDEGMDMIRNAEEAD